MNQGSEKPEWVICQGCACVWVRARSEEAAVRRAAERLGHMGSWQVGPEVDQKVFPVAAQFEIFPLPEN